MDSLDSILPLLKTLSVEVHALARSFLLKVCCFFVKKKGNICVIITKTSHLKTSCLL